VRSIDSPLVFSSTLASKADAKQTTSGMLV
jgi:hypothetical protein